MDNDKKKQPRYVAENRTVCQTGTVPDDAICWCDNHDDAEYIADCLNACDGFNNLTLMTMAQLHANFASKDAEIARLKAALRAFDDAFVEGCEEDNLRAAMVAYGQAVDLALNTESEATDGQ